MGEGHFISKGKANITEITFKRINDYIKLDL